MENGYPEGTPPHLVPRKIIEGFIVDIRRLSIIYGSQKNLSNALGVSVYTLHRWFSGKRLPSFQVFLQVKQLMAEKLQEGHGSPQY